ncbi:hypothetical protein ERO13_D05G202400v2 [Gossypium hirsutum]|uniref:Protein NRT1/ PTR FAMILY 4.6 isoform X3 n=3 Tax=Gossypium TaxID=3633 RepID=A0A1U8MVL6_GOSHI|nr:protein NRT1/ PTR FAMILY 4.6-like isoform X3 [Gossypium hirsutum]XP_040950057.1 protein NRT1/ PTR FAMILY 4.6-like isoform X3 [Gossypium hirsutum]KAB2030123.1 hypothetical protein ES319_D05G209500v1 [Gossypium barbadense]KAG4147102.1 hypothetical protein ERO13_D05G202400v2 [Gossypium hirsutum]KAG4147103.1 hypothetical protein ERO13_D05G202400v2 [Gossypium hirsutum]
MTWPSKKQNVGDKGYTFCLCHGMAGEYGIYLKCHKPALFGGFISDTYLSRFKTCVLFGSIELLGYAALTAQVHFHRLRPPSCQGLAISQTTQCQAADSGQAAILFTGLYHVAFGASGVKAALLSLGADQFDERDPKRSSFFNWFLLSFAVGAIIGVTFIVWISTNQGNGRWMHAR